MGSLCCVASRQHGSNAASGDWSMGQDEPYLQTNTSFSPTPSRWDFRFHSEGLPYSLHDDIQLYGSSTSSNEKDSPGWIRGNHLYDLHYSASDGAGIFLSSPSDLSQGPQWTPPATQEIIIDHYEIATRKEGTSENPDSGDSTLSQSEASESESTTKSLLSLQRNFSNHRSFISKPIHPLSFQAFDPAVASFSESDASDPRRDAQCWSSASSSLNFVDISEKFESETSVHPHIPSDRSSCSLCERFLSQRSPWSSRQIVRSGDMPTAGVLPCRHAFHAECLEQATLKSQKNDPPCPLCVILEGGNSSDQRGLSRLKKGFPRLKPFCEDGPSRHWGCAQVGDHIEGGLHAPPHNALFLLNQSRSQKNLE